MPEGTMQMAARRRLVRRGHLGGLSDHPVQAQGARCAVDTSAFGSGARVRFSVKQTYEPADQLPCSPTTACRSIADWFQWSHQRQDWPRSDQSQNGPEGPDVGQCGRWDRPAATSAMWPIADVGDVAQMNRSFGDHRIHTPHAKDTIAPRSGHSTLLAGQYVSLTLLSRLIGANMTHGRRRLSCNQRVLSPDVDRGFLLHVSFAYQDLFNGRGMPEVKDAN